MRKEGREEEGVRGRKGKAEEGDGRKLLRVSTLFSS